MDDVFQLGFDRFLTPFDSRHVPAYRYDLVVLGGGVGGAFAALAAAERGLSVAVLTKAGAREGNTRYAQGGLAAVLGGEDSFESHLADTLRVGCGLCERAVVDRIVRGAPEVVERLIALGTEFDRASDGSWSRSREGGHTFARVIHAQGDATGLEIQRALSEGLRAHPRITGFPDTFAVDLLSGEGGRVTGVLAETQRGELVAFCAANVLLATGGAGQVYRETTNPPVATGDGIAMAVRAGAAVRDLEFVQFHPTCLYIAGAARALISEIVRGHGGRLVDKQGRRFMPDAHPDAELAPRDVVSRAVFRRMVETGDTNVYLDLSHVDGDPHTLFPGISRVCRVFGMDIACDPIPVRPGAHYLIGGVLTDGDGRSSLPGLWAVGECASVGLHGANRMGSNSLLEGLVMGVRAGHTLAEEVPTPPSAAAFSGGHPRRRYAKDDVLDINIEDLTYSLKSMMWRHMGVERDAAGMDEARDKIAFWMRVVEELATSNRRSWVLRNMLTVSRLATLSALARGESRGVHYRTDLPGQEPEPARHTVLVPRLERGRIVEVALSRPAVGAPRPLPAR
ncbi:MAG: L-aspartate oxidase [Planctomycetes bacterium]|nr:L-aspartate oxidase [Planctomycetota bacterium]